MLRLGWFSTGRGAGSRNLLKAVMDGKENGSLDIDVPFVFCNWDNTEKENPRKEQRQMFFDMTKDYGIPLITESWKSFCPKLRASDESAWRREYGELLRRDISGYDIDLGILAGYMLWMDDITCTRYDMLNLHPALPDGPKGTWQDVIWKLIEGHADRQGAMMHICTEDWDRGNALTYCSFSLRSSEYNRLWKDIDKKLETSSLKEIKNTEGSNNPLFKKIREDGAKRELPLVVSTIGLFADGKVRMENRKLIDMNGKELKDPYDLTCEVDAEVL